ncbi:MAG: VPLPA-CTERM sorting domain-containing protein [Halieaceae bacterium]|jgi:hypothetical protein|nr:VPLPA-CTERM sorting domain-containing protein [Halieaceae bacterium]
MNMKATVAAAALLAGSTFGVSAATFNVLPGTASGSNDFQASIETFFGGAGNVAFATLVGVTVAEDELLTFILAGAESGNTNTFTAEFLEGTATLTESNNGLNPSPATLGNFASISGTFAAGALNAGDLSFDGSGDSVNASFGHPAMGVYYNPSISGDQRFLIAYDDNATDDNHDDMIIEAFGTVTPVPLPAAGWMLLAGLTGMAALRRRKKS